MMKVGVLNRPADATFYSLVADVRHILVMRPNAVGDYMFALPALHALRDSYPDARITLLGKPWHADFLRHRAGPVNDVIVLPPLPGIGDGHGAVPAPREEAACALVTRLRAMHVDLAMQMYGGGRHSNPFISSLGARLSVGARTADAAPLERCIRYSACANRRLELLQIAALVGAFPRPRLRDLIPSARDQAMAETALPFHPGERIAIIHPGASDARRCWPPARFALVADALAREGAHIVISANDNEAHLARQVVEAMRYPATDLSGKLPLPALCGLLDRARMMVTNDTGPLHMSLALGTPAVAVFWLTNLVESFPLIPQLLRPALSVRIDCPVCGRENLHSRCEHDVSFVADVPTEEVTSLAMDLYHSLA